jgi:hypothetical protein
MGYDAVFEKLHAIPIAGRTAGMDARRAETHYKAHSAAGFQLIIA